MKIKINDIIRVEYTGTLKNGKVFDTSKGRAPLVFKAGAKQVIPGFEDAIMTMEKGEEKTVTIPCKEAYGERNEELIKDFPKKGLPEGMDPKPGQMLGLMGPGGHQVPAKIVKVSEDTLTLDLNPPLAGEDLTFKLKLVGINEEGDEDPAKAMSASENKDKKESEDCSDEGCHSCSGGC